ncbi:MAG: hypothetical protein ACRELT_01830, partial [Longimicrobiales bacterium]
VELNPFRADRSSAPLDPVNVAIEPPQESMPVSVQPILIGTTVGGSRAIALLRTPTTPPRAVQIGDTVADFTVERISRAEVVLTAPDTVLILRVLPSGSK